MTDTLIAQFDTPEKLIQAARRIARAGHHPSDALTPFALPELAEMIEDRPTRIRPTMLTAGLLTAIVAYGVQWFSAVIDYPLNVGGRPLNSWPVFLLVPFEVALLAAALAGFVAFLRECGLPRLYHPLFDAPDVERASQDRFFLVAAANPASDLNELRHALEDLGAVSVSAVAP